MSMKSPKRESLDMPGFWALITTQFQGAFNDNLYKFIIIFYMTNKLSDGESSIQARFTILALSSALFALPYLAFPGIAGALADRFSKRSIAIATKCWEVGVMLLALIAFRLDHHPMIWTIFFLMCMQSAFFSPAKYGILPEILPESRLSWGNGVLNMATFVAIIAGQGCAGLLYYYDLSPGAMAALLILLSLGGLCASLRITRVPAASADRPIPINPWSGLGRDLKGFTADAVLFRILLAGIFFFFAGAVVQQNVMNLGEAALHLDELRISILTASVAVGIGTGSLAAGFLSRRKIELGLIPIGLLGMMLTALLLGAPSFGFRGVLLLLFALGFAGGFFEVPVLATVQHRSPKENKGGMIAAFNVATSAGIFLAGGALYLAGIARLTPHQVFWAVAALCLVVGLYLCYALPVFVLRSILWCMINTLYRIKTLGSENVPQKGGALLVANHTSFVDALFLTASIDRPIRFLMSTDIYKTWWIRPLAKLADAIPISQMEGPRELVRSMKEASQAIERGDLVCIFAEGQISRTGQMLPFRKGFERIMKGVEAPIIPVHLDRLWGSVFSHSEGRFFWKWPKRVPYPVTVNYGAPLPADTTAFTLRNQIRELGTEAYMQRKLAHPLLHRGFIRNARRHPLRMAMADATVPHMSYLKALIACIIFGRKLNRLLDDQPMVGVLVPPTVGGALTNIALQIMGKVPVNLNYTASDAALASAARQCGITQVITAKKVLEKLPLTVPGDSIFLEDVKASVKGSDRILAMIMAVFFPARLLERALGCKRKRSQDDLATVIFSSGSEGEPKGVPLTHFNVSSNIEAGLQVFPLNETDSVVGILPFFHSFGFTGTLWLTFMAGISAVFHPSPLEAKAVGGLIYQHRCTFLVTAPTFLQNFIRRCLPEELSSLRYVVTGAEKLPDRIRDAFTTKFGVEPLEGYGTTECAPVVSLNIPDFRAPGYYQVGSKRGTIGQPLPGISVRIVDPDTDEILPDEEPGMLLVKGANVMSGYLGLPEKTAEVLHDGWYTTGDIAKLDEDGFITITDRLARFSKIGGEMVPHTKVEEVLHSLLGLTDLAMAVTGVPDMAKGERLVVLHTLEEEQLEELQGKLSKSDLPNLWIPRSNSFYRVEEIPILGTGKMNLRAVKNLANELDVGVE